MSCVAEIKQGRRKGDICGRKNKKGCQYCHYHSKKIIVIDPPVNDNKNPEKKEIDQCCICLDSLQNDVLTLKCNHKFHDVCLVQINNNKCPLCRKKISGVPKLVELVLKKNLANDKKITELEESIGVFQQEINRRSPGDIPDIPVMRVFMTPGMNRNNLEEFFQILQQSQPIND
jgi:hypothetical protein